VGNLNHSKHQVELNNIYITIQFLPHRKQTACPWLSVNDCFEQRENIYIYIYIYIENYTKHISVTGGPNAVFLNVKSGGTYANH